MLETTYGILDIDGQRSEMGYVSYEITMPHADYIFNVLAKTFNNL